MNKLFTIFSVSDDSLLQGRKDRLKMLRFIKNTFIIAQKATCCFLSKKFSCFDAQVGETSCQIRGYKIATLGNQLNDTLFYNHVKNIDVMLKKKLKLAH